MDLQKPSHLRSLIPAVLVGLLALAANQYTKMDPKALRDSLDAMEKHLTELTKSSKKPVSTLSVRQENLEKLRETVSSEFDKWQKQRHQVDEDKLRSAVAETNHVFRLLEESETLSPEDRRNARLTQLIIHFMAAEMRPDSYSDSFLKLCADVIQNDALDDSDHVAVLRFYHQVEFDRPDRDVLVKELREFSESHNTQAGVALYRMIAEQLTMRGHRELAVSVLKQGIQIYSGSLGVSRLVNALVDIESGRHSSP